MLSCLNSNFYISLFSCPFSYIKGSLNINALKLILGNPNLVPTSFGNNLFDPNYGAHP